MKAMIFAAGLGTRLAPFTNHHPKALAMVNGKSLLQRQIEYLQSFGIYDVVVNVFHFADQIIDLLKDQKGFGSNIIISDERDTVLETGGGIKYAAHHFKGEPFFIAINADIITDLNLKQMICMHVKGKNFATLAVMQRPSSRELLFCNQQHLAGWRNNTNDTYKWCEQPASQFYPRAFSGVQILSNDFLDLDDFDEKFSVIDVYLKRGAQEKIYGYDHTGDLFIDVGKPESLEHANQLFSSETVY